MAYINTETLEYPIHEGDIKILYPKADEVPSLYAFVNPTEEPELFPIQLVICPLAFIPSLN